MRKPNLFIIGAPKCGTTSLFDWLKTHPQIFLPSNKEPGYFSKDLWTSNRMSEQNYLKLFKYANSTHTIIGEASTRYLYSREAIDNILDYCDKPKFIAMVRNPVDMIYSLHNHLLYLNVEHCESFRDAWGLKEVRAQGKHIVDSCSDPDSLAYGKIGQLGEQIERLFEKVPSSQRLVILMDDMKADPSLIYRNVLSFLNVEDDKRDNFPASNQSMKWRSKNLNRAANWLSRGKRKLGIKVGFGLLNKFSQVNRRQSEREPLPEYLRTEMKEYYFNDILKLSHLLNRDLSEWVK